MSFAKLDDLGHRLQALEHALAILGADEATHMAVGGGGSARRGDVFSGRHVSSTGHGAGNRRLDRRCRGRTLNDEQLAALREFKRSMST